MHASSLELTFAGPRALDPAVLRMSVASTSALRIPSTARCTTTDAAGFLERAALCARGRTSECCRDACLADKHVSYELAIRHYLVCNISICS